MKRVLCSTFSVTKSVEPDPRSDKTPYYSNLIQQALCDRPDLIVLSEAGDWDIRVPLAEHLRGREVAEQLLLRAMRQTAREHGVWVAFGAFRPRESGGYANSAYLLDPAGEPVYVYDKAYLTEPELEAGVLPGPGAQVFDTTLGRIAPIICFELNFADLRNRVAALSPELILFHSQFHGGFQQLVWAYACRCHLVSAVDELPGGVLSPTGRLLATTANNYTGTVTCPLNLDCCLAHLDGNREKLAALKHEYGPEVEVHDPGLIGSVEIMSLNASVSAVHMAAAFEIELLDDYLNRLAQARDLAAPQIRASRTAT